MKRATTLPVGPLTGPRCPWRLLYSVLMIHATLDTTEVKNVIGKNEETKTKKQKI